MCDRNGRKMLNNSLKFLAQRLICMCVMISIAQAFVENDNNHLDDSMHFENQSTDLLDRNGTHRKGRCESNVLFLSSSLFEIILIDNSVVCHFSIDS